jgi:hypothetical protein
MQQAQLRVLAALRTSSHFADGSCGTAERAYY